MTMTMDASHRMEQGLRYALEAIKEILSDPGLSDDAEVGRALEQLDEALDGDSEALRKLYMWLVERADPSGVAGAGSGQAPIPLGAD